LAITYLSLGDRAAALDEYAAIKDKDSQLAAQLYNNIFRDRLLDVKKK
jgi:hypothetical protein